MAASRIAGAPLDFAALRAELEVPGDFAPAVVAEAATSAARWPGASITSITSTTITSTSTTGTSGVPEPLDATDIAFVTLDPAGSRDLDQAYFLERTSGGYRVNYAIADVAAFVAPGSALDVEAWRRGQTLYFPDARVPLYPPSLSEGAASLLPGQLRPAVLWRIDLDTSGNITAVDVRRARVRSRRQLDYEGVQRQLESAQPPDDVALLAEIGRACLAVGRAAHAIDLDLPAQEVVPDGRSWTLVSRRPLPVESYNAQLSILTGRCAAALMLQHRIGILRVVPQPRSDAVRALRRAATALGVDWPTGVPPGDVLAGLDRADPRHVAFIDHAASLLRGAGYVAFDGSPPADPGHAGIGAPYAHVTAPLRRLVDRYASEVCLAVAAGGAVPDWTRARLADLPSTMAGADHLEHVVDRAVVDMTEAWLLGDRIGQVFDATVIDVSGRAGDAESATVVLDAPAVRARCTGTGLEPGTQISARLTVADVASRQVRFEAS